MSGLLMKYFVLKPKGEDVYAKAARKAMIAYANEIEKENPQFATDVRNWVADEWIEESEEEQAKNLTVTTEHKACPCHHLDEPCHPDCTCINPFSSHGCSNCCTYGNEEQQKAAAKHLSAKGETQIKLIDQYVALAIDNITAYAEMTMEELEDNQLYQHLKKLKDGYERKNNLQS